MVKRKEEYLDEAKETKKNASTKKADTKAKRKPKTKKKEKKPSIFSRIHSYFKGVNSEMKKTKWPSKKDMVLYSSATLLFIVIFALFFTLNDVIISGIHELLRGIA